VRALERAIVGRRWLIIAAVARVEHLLVAEAGTDARSRYVIMVGVHVDDPDAVAERLTDGGDDRVLDVLRALAFDVTIAFASKQRQEALGDDWRYALMNELVKSRFNPNRPGWSPLVAHLPEGMPLDREWIDAFLTDANYGLVRVRTTIVRRDQRVLLLPQLVARLFQEAIEDDSGHRSTARARYDALAPLIGRVEDVGLHVSYFRGGTASDAIIRGSLSS
jgi:hypothetical protein